MPERDVTIQSQGRALDCYLAFPDGVAGRRPAVIVIHEIFGPDAHIRDVARRFAKAGYVSAAPNLFTGELQRELTPANIALAMQAFARAPPDLRRNPAKMAEFAATQPPDRRPIIEAFGRISSPTAHASFARDLLAVSRYLGSLPEVDSARIGSVGFCFGGAISARFATVAPELRAAVIFYGQNPPLEDVAKVNAHVLGLYGGEDPGITGTVPDLAAAMKGAGKQFEYHVYAGAKHAFFNDTRPNYHEASARDAWERVTGFFTTNLGSPSEAASGT